MHFSFRPLFVANCDSQSIQFDLLCVIVIVIPRTYYFLRIALIVRIYNFSNENKVQPPTIYNSLRVFISSQREPRSNEKKNFSLMAILYPILILMLLKYRFPSFFCLHLSTFIYGYWYHLFFLQRATEWIGHSGNVARRFRMPFLWNE